MQYLQLADGDLGESKFLRGLTAVATGGASEAARGVFGKKKSSTPTCACDTEKSLITKLAKQIKNCKKETGWKPKMKRTISYNPTTKIATVIDTPSQQLSDDFSLSAGITDLVGGALKATPYGAAISTAGNLVKGLFGKKSSSASGGSSSAASDALAKVAQYTKENAQLKKDNATFKKQVKNLQMQRYYYGGGGLALGIGAGMLLKK